MRQLLGESRGVRPEKAVAPPVRGGFQLPYLGSALDFGRNPVEFLRRAQRRLGNVFSFPLLGKQVTVLLGPKAHEAFFRAPDDQLSLREAYRVTVPIFGPGVAYDASPEQYDAHLALLFPALRDERLQAYARIMQDEAERYFERWPDRGEVDLLDAMNELTMYTSSRTLIGDEFRSRVSAEFARLYNSLEGGLNMLNMLVSPYLPTLANYRRDKARARVVEIISGIVRERRLSGREGVDFLQTLMSARLPDGTALNDETITGILLTLVFAGQHTSAVTATWTGVLLLQHPLWLGPILAEQAKVFGSDDLQITLERLKALHVLERSIMEAERLHPPFVLLMRTVLRDLEFGGFCAPAGGLAMVSATVAHRLPEVFADPDRYDPDRFASPRKEHKRNNYALIGFGGGKHRCVGATFAYLQIKAIWSVLLSRFDLHLTAADYRPDYSDMVVGPRHPCTVRFERRRRASGSGQSEPKRN